MRDTCEGEPTTAGANLEPVWRDPMLVSLLEEHETLLKRLKRKRREYERFTEEAEAMRTQLLTRANPLEEEGRSLDDAIHALFDQILNRPRLGKRARAEVEALYENLQRWGTLSPRTLQQPESPNDDGDDEFEASFEPDPHGPDFEAHEPPPEPEPLAAQPHRGRGEDKKKLRAIFLKLAAALHPDKVQDDQEKQRRTELMKDLNRAYREGDAARILEIESRLEMDASAKELPEETEVERRSRVLKNQNELLAEQYSEVLEDLRTARRSELGEALIEVRRLKRNGAPDPYLPLIAPIEESVVALQKMHAHVEAFSRGKIKLDEFLEGPGARGDHVVDMLGEILATASPRSHDPNEDMMEFLAAMAEEILNSDAPPGRARGTSKKNRSR